MFLLLHVAIMIVVVIIIIISIIIVIIMGLIYTPLYLGIWRSVTGVPQRVTHEG